jgi:hypothetical protein
LGTPETALKSPVSAETYSYHGLLGIDFAIRLDSPVVSIHLAGLSPMAEKPVPVEKPGLRKVAGT